MKIKTLASLAALFAAVAFSSGAANAQAKLKAGTLTCRGGAGVGLILGSQRTYDCTFSGKNRTEHYRATVTRIGLDIGITGKSVILWKVFASTDTPGARLLAGTYAGAAASAALGVGGGAQVLVGGSKNSIVLQPLSVQGEKGINLALGVAGMTLR